MRRLVVHAARHDLQRLTAALREFVRGDVNLVGHRLQHDVPALDRRLGIGKRRAPRRALNHTGNQRRLAQPRFATSLPKKMRDASATPWIANEPRCPR